MGLLRAVSFTFALSLSTALLVPLMSAAGRTTDDPVVNAVAAVAVAIGVLATDLDVETGKVWTFGGAAFLVGVRVVSVAIGGAVAFRD